jgi:hypothetical protein
MASTIKLKNGSGAPTTGDLVQGEPALDLTNKRLYTENASGVVIEVGTNPSTIDINAGTIDGTVIGGSSAAAITGTTITGTSFVSSGDMTFGDSDKAIFGAGSDLQIYHDGSNSYVQDAGTGSLNIKSNGAFIDIQSDSTRINNAANNEIMATFVANGAVTAYYDNSAKLATTATGIDVTGTVTADGLTVDGNSRINGDFTIDTAPKGFSFASSLEMGSGGSLAVFGNANTNLYSNVYFASDATFKVINTGYSAAAHQLVNGSHIFSTASAAGTAGSSIDLFTRMNIAKTGDISFYEDTGTTAKFFWDASAESLGIGTSSPDALLEVAGTTNDALFNLTGAGTNFELRATSGNGASANTSVYRLALDYLNGTYTNGFIDFYRGAAGNNGYLAFGSTGTERMRIDSSGNLLVGTTSSTASLGQTSKLQVAGGIRSTSGFTSSIDVGTIAQNATTSVTIPHNGLWMITNGANLSALILITLSGGSAGVQLVFSTSADTVVGGTSEPAGGTYLRIWMSAGGGTLQVKNVNAYTGPYYMTPLATGTS